ncbi:hypothetical protein FH972_014595 [Carpinus fangiana]|uniref:CAAX prenyl protease 2/Lysostaphin resistance protein A-like domain-containing protein n=1 Tax=Carpinus fangiana TaxID=176857 RepID=A0A5N6RB86_9ROSI|nr:hypothetical protein FH972_014595 [Carpinus fangiana]
MIVLQCGPVYPTPSKLSIQLSQPPTSFPSPSALLCSSKSKFKLKASFKCSCTQNEDTHEASYQGFSVLARDIPWDTGSVWTTMAFYMFNLHIPLSFGGLSVVTWILHEPHLDPQTEVLSLLVVQILEFIATLFLLQWTAKPKYEFLNLFKAYKLSKERNWLLASILGFGFLFLLVFLTSILADRLIGSKPVNNPILKEILLSNDISKAACVLLYCIVTPVLEETVYRGFLLTSMLPTMKLQQAIFISSVIFSAAHFSAENFLQLVIIGCVLGSSYCWTGNLSSSIAIHSLYNAMTLMLTLLS